MQIPPIIKHAIFTGAPGFISKKYFIINETRAFCGLCEWENEELAQNYIQSYPGDFVKRNALPNSL